MFVKKIEEEYINNVNAMVNTNSDPSRWRTLLILATLIFGFLIWASLFEIEEITRGSGRVIPSSQVKIVQNLEGGIVRAINVREGDVVEAGQVLIQIDDTGFISQQGELKKQEAALLAEQIRLNAEARMDSEIAFDSIFVRNNPLASAAETEVFLSRRTQLKSDIAILESDFRQRVSELAELEARQEKRKNVIIPLSEERDLTATLVASRAVPRVELLRLNAQLAELEGDLTIGEATKQRLNAAIEEAENEIASVQSAYILMARQRLARLQVELAIIQEALRAANDRVARTQLRSPVRGTLNRLNVATIGAVVQPGAPLAEIVPSDDGLLIEANLLPKDVAFIKPGDSVSVKITAYDYLIYGSLDGIVERIGADTISDREGREFFEITVSTEKNYLGRETSPLPISPGMVATIDIQTGRKTILDYLLKPIRRAQSEALRER